VATEKKIIGILGLSDQIKEESKQAVEELSREMIQDAGSVIQA